MAQELRETVIETMSLTKIYKDFWGRDKVKAVDNLNLKVGRGQVFGLLGPNGSGKTTTIKMLLGLLYPSTGRAKIFGKSPTNVEVKSQIGYLPEETRLYQFLNSWETLDFYGRIFNLDSAERKRRSEALVDMVGLGPAASRPVGQYSKGMARRIGLAQSLINDPDLLILDEPTSGLDPIGTRQIKDLLLELKKRGKTIVLCSHLLADVEDVCDQVAIMYGGKLLCSGEIEGLLAQQDITQIQMENLDEKKANELKKYLESNFGEKILSFGSPRDRLEQFFLRMIYQAEKDMFTHGALASGKVSEFLRAASTESGEALLEKLSAGEEIVLETKPNEAPPAAKEEVEHQLLEQLAGEQKDEPSAAVFAPGDAKQMEQSQARQSQDQVDRNLLNGLLDNAGDDSNRQNGSEG
jgi:ABC-2 type transport system ATP-binding protein